MPIYRLMTPVGLHNPPGQKKNSSTPTSRHLQTPGINVSTSPISQSYPPQVPPTNFSTPRSSYPSNSVRPRLPSSNPPSASHKQFSSPNYGQPYSQISQGQDSTPPITQPGAPQPPGVPPPVPPAPPLPAANFSSFSTPANHDNHAWNESNAQEISGSGRAEQNGSVDVTLSSSSSRHSSVETAFRTELTCVLDRRQQPAAADHQKQFVHDSFILREFEEQKRREEELSRQRQLSSQDGATSSSTAAADSDINDGDSSPSDVPSSSQHTYAAEYADHVSAQDDFIRPRQDTVIEREIRLSRQRESSMRRVHGYPPLASRRQQQQASVVVIPIPPTSSFTATGTATQLTADQTSANTGPASDDDVALRRLATNRLKMEIMRERQRELDLRQQGKISTISEERIAPPQNLTNIVENNGGDTRTTVQQHSVDGATVRQYQQASAGASSFRQKYTAPRSVGEKLIEEEVKELRRREQELREQRKLLNSN